MAVDFKSSRIASAFALEAVCGAADDELLSAACSLLTTFAPADNINFKQTLASARLTAHTLSSSHLPLRSQQSLCHVSLSSSAALPLCFGLVFRSFFAPCVRRDVEADPQPFGCVRRAEQGGSQRHRIRQHCHTLSTAKRGIRPRPCAFCLTSPYVLILAARDG